MLENVYKWADSIESRDQFDIVKGVDFFKQFESVQNLYENAFE